MKLQYGILVTFTSLILMSCPQSQPQVLIDHSIEAHGASYLGNAKLEFDFRNIHYTYQKKDGKYEYTRSFQDSLGFIKDVLTNDNFIRYIDDVDAKVDEEWAGKYSNSVNSVIYFALLPYGLNDGAVHKEIIREEIIKGEKYDVVKVSFAEDGGGEDHSDVFYYLVNDENLEVDYFGYTYETDGGGIRFREAFNKRRVGGVLFQDYINYRPEKSIEKQTSLDQLIELFKANNLEELSRIELKNIKVN